MLVPTDVFRQYSWIGIDPGLSTCGFAVFTKTDDLISSINPFTVINNQIRYESGYPEQYHSDRAIRMNKLCLTFQELLYQVNPVLVCCESPFYNPRMPSAFGSLTETVAALRLETARFNPMIPFVTYSPQEVKQSFKQSGKLGKMVMKDALLNHVEICSKLMVPAQTLDEHSIDAVAVGYTWYLHQVNERG